MMKVKSADAGVGAMNRRKILQAAEKCFAQFGFKGTAVQKIADEAAKSSMCIPVGEGENCW